METLHILWRARMPALLVAAALLLAGCGQPAVFAQRPNTGSAGEPSPTPNGATVGQAAQTTVAPSAAVAGAQSYRDLPVGLTSEGYPYLGQPDAPVTLEEYSDFLCPFCARHFTQTLPALIEKYVASGQVKYVFRDMPLASLHPTSAKGHAAARCVAQQGAAVFWKMHDELFARQGEWSQLADPSAFLQGAAQGTGVDMTVYASCLASGEQAALIDKSIAAGQAAGFNGTPSFRIVRNDGKTSTLSGAYPIATFTASLDAALAGKDPPADSPAQTQAQVTPAPLPLWANAQGLAPDPARPGYTTGGDAYKGNPQAKIAVVEFSNFQCPACRQHELEVQPSLDKALVGSGQVLWVFKNLPFKSLPQSAAAAAAAECAGDQNRFWEIYDLLFQKQKEWAVDKPDPILEQLAGGLGLDGARFSACLKSRQSLERVLDDMFDAQGVATTTPTFVILSGGKGTILRGSRPVDQFIQTVQGASAMASPQEH